MRRTPALLAALVLGAAVAAGVPAAQSPADRVRVTAFPRGEFVLAEGRRAVRVNLANRLAGCTAGLYDGSDPKSRPEGGEATTRVLDLVRRGNGWFLTFQATLQANCNVMGECGAGRAVTLVWLRLGADLRVQDRQTAVVADCRRGLDLVDWTGRVEGRPLDGDDPALEVRGGALKAESALTRADGTEARSTVRYERARAERGLIVAGRAE